MSSHQATSLTPNDPVRQTTHERAVMNTVRELPVGLREEILGDSGSGSRVLTKISAAEDGFKTTAPTSIS